MKSEGHFCFDSTLTNEQIVNGMIAPYQKMDSLLSLTDKGKFSKSQTVREPDLEEEEFTDDDFSNIGGKWVFTNIILINGEEWMEPKIETKCGVWKNY
ncbi:MAG: hypothetical protein R3B93_15410 [Bacteroidia bacterium]